MKHFLSLLLLLSPLCAFQAPCAVEALNLGKAFEKSKARVLHQWSRQPSFRAPPPASLGSTNQVNGTMSSSSGFWNTFRLKVVGSSKKRFLSFAAVLLLWTTVLSSRAFLADTAHPGPSLPATTVAKTQEVVIASSPKIGLGKMITTSGLVVLAVVGGQKMANAFLKRNSLVQQARILDADPVDSSNGNGLSLEEEETDDKVPNHHSLGVSGTPQSHSRDDIARAVVHRILNETAAADQPTNVAYKVPTTSAPKNTSRTQMIRRQPLPRKEELALQARYAAIPDVSERAYQVLLDLGLAHGG
jgi:hypothetical protein